MTAAPTRALDRVSKFLIPEIVFGHGALSEAGWLVLSTNGGQILDYEGVDQVTRHPAAHHDPQPVGHRRALVPNISITDRGC